MPAREEDEAEARRAWGFAAWIIAAGVDWHRRVLQGGGELASAGGAEWGRPGLGVVLRGVTRRVLISQLLTAVARTKDRGPRPRGQVHHVRTCRKRALGQQVPVRSS